MLFSDLPVSIEIRFMLMFNDDESLEGLSTESRTGKKNDADDSAKLATQTDDLPQTYCSPLSSSNSAPQLRVVLSSPEALELQALFEYQDDEYSQQIETASSSSLASITSSLPGLSISPSSALSKSKPEPIKHQRRQNNTYQNTSASLSSPNRMFSRSLTLGQLKGSITDSPSKMSRSYTELPNTLMPTLSVLMLRKNIDYVLILIDNYLYGTDLLTTHQTLASAFVIKLKTFAQNLRLSKLANQEELNACYSDSADEIKNMLLAAFKYKHKQLKQEKIADDIIIDDIDTSLTLVEIRRYFDNLEKSFFDIESNVKKHFLYLYEQLITESFASLWKIKKSLFDIIFEIYYKTNMFSDFERLIFKKHCSPIKKYDLDEKIADFIIENLENFLGDDLIPQVTNIVSFAIWLNCAVVANTLETEGIEFKKVRVFFLDISKRLRDKFLTDSGLFNTQQSEEFRLISSLFNSHFIEYSEESGMEKSWTDFYSYLLKKFINDAIIISNRYNKFNKDSKYYFDYFREHFDGCHKKNIEIYNAIVTQFDALINNDVTAAQCLEVFERLLLDFVTSLQHPSQDFVICNLRRRLWPDATAFKAWFNQETSEDSMPVSLTTKRLLANRAPLIEGIFSPGARPDLTSMLFTSPFNIPSSSTPPSAILPAQASAVEPDLTCSNPSQLNDRTKPRPHSEPYGLPPLEQGTPNRWSHSLDDISGRRSSGFFAGSSSGPRVPLGQPISSKHLSGQYNAGEGSASHSVAKAIHDHRTPAGQRISVSPRINWDSILTTACDTIAQISSQSSFIPSLTFPSPK